MFSRIMILIVLVLLTEACTPGGPPAGTGASTLAAPSTAPTGASIGPSGYATIIDAPPAPFTPAEPGQPLPPTPQQIAGNAQFARAGEFQNRVRDQVTALDGRLRRSEGSNYVGPYYDNEGTPTAVFQFLRDGPATLAKYTRNPQFVGETVRFSEAELMAASQFMWDAFGKERVLESTGIGKNSVTAVISVPEEEFRVLVARKGVKLPEAVALQFRATKSASDINAPLPPQLAALVRIFPRDDRSAGILHSINSYAKVELRDGCFRIADKDGAHVLFPLGARLFIDSAGYLAFGAEAPGYARVGESLIFPGSIGEVTAAALVDPIHAACGSGKVMKINGTGSAHAGRAQSAVTANASALRYFQNSYGLSAAAARTAVERCKAQAGTDFCPMSPPRPVASQSECPPRTKLSHGLCRTPEGYIRPVPEWLSDLLQR